MGYSTTDEVDLIIAQALTSGKPNLPTGQRVNLVSIGNTRDLNRIPNDTVEFYITLADSQIDGILSQMYATPFDKCHHGSWDLDEDIRPLAVAGTAGTGLADTGGDVTTTSSSKTIVVSSANNLVPGDEIIIHDDLTGDEEIVIVATIVDQNTFTTTTDIVGTYLADSDVRIIRIRFSPPLNQISARLAASFIYDKYFAAQAEPDISDYGKEMRIVAMGQMNDILNGKIILKCGDRIGDRFASSTIDDTYAHRDRGYNTNERDMSKLQ